MRKKKKSRRCYQSIKREDAFFFSFFSSFSIKRWRTPHQAHSLVVLQLPPTRCNEGSFKNDKNVKYQLHCIVRGSMRFRHEKENYTENVIFPSLVLHVTESSLKRNWKGIHHLYFDVRGDAKVPYPARRLTMPFHSSYALIIKGFVLCLRLIFSPKIHF